MAYENERSKMVSQQLVPRGISDKGVIEVFGKVPRHEFVSKKLLNEAYTDYPLSIGEGQTISQPYIVALMTECLKLDGTQKILEIGTGSGYQTAILAELANEIYSVERLQPLAENARQALDRLGYKNIKINVGDGTLGWEEFAPYDAIVVTAAAPRPPRSLLNQLKDGGRLVIPIGESFSQVLEVIEKTGNTFKTTHVCGCVFVPLIGKEGWKESGDA